MIGPGKVLVIWVVHDICLAGSWGLQVAGVFSTFDELSVQPWQGIVTDFDFLVGAEVKTFFNSLQHSLTSLVNIWVVFRTSILRT